MLGYASSNEALADDRDPFPRAYPCEGRPRRPMIQMLDPVADRVFGIDPELARAVSARDRIVVSPYGNALVLDRETPERQALSERGWAVVTDAAPRPGIPFEGLALEACQMRALTRLVHQPTGLVVATGPCGAGKSRLVEACLERSLRLYPSLTIVSVEAPVERLLAGVTQIAVVPRPDEWGQDYGPALVEAARRSPHVVYVDEVRTSQTAGVTLALARHHKVWTAMHVGDSGVSERLAEMGACVGDQGHPVVGSVALRLLPGVCPSCAEEARPAELASALGRAADAIPASWRARLRTRNAYGCRTCLAHDGRRPGLGSGRVSVAEVVEVEAGLGHEGVASRRAWLRRPDSLTFEEHCWVRLLRGEVDLGAAGHAADIRDLCRVRVDRVEAVLAA